MMNITCSTCLESFTSGCDISTTPCGHVFHTGCITRWLHQNDNCSQCREVCEIRQIIKLYFSESQSAIEQNITINDLEQKSLKLEEQSQKCEQELTAMKTLVLDKSIEINRANQMCKKLEHEKLLMKLDWSKTEWNLKKEIDGQKMMILDWSKTEWNLKRSVNFANKRIKDLEKEVNDQKQLTLLNQKSNTGLAELGVKRPCIIAAKPRYSDLIPALKRSLKKSINKGNKQIEDEKMVDKTNSGLKRKAGESEGAQPALKRNLKDCPSYINDDERNIGKVIINMLDIFIATLDRLRTGIKSANVLYINCKKLWEYLNILSTRRSYANYALNCVKLENWLNLLKNMNISYELTDDQVREMNIDFNNAYETLKKLSINRNVEHQQPRQPPSPTPRPDTDDGIWF